MQFVMSHNQKCCQDTSSIVQSTIITCVDYIILACCSPSKLIFVVFLLAGYSLHPFTFCADLTFVMAI